MSGVINNPNRREVTAAMLATAARRMTAVCASRDWNERDHIAVLARYRGDELLQAFLQRNLAAELNPPNLLRRSRVSHDHGPREMGKLTTEGWRAWLWYDDGTEYASMPIEHTVVWMFARGRRADDSPHQDLQHTHEELIGDPNDTWIPTDADYDAYLGEVRQQWGIAAAAAIEEAARLADEHPNQVVDVQINRIEGKTIRFDIHDHDVAGCVIFSYGVRYFALARYWQHTGEYISEADALILAGSAFSDLEDDAWGEIETDIRVADITIPWSDFYYFEGELS